jgi:hypothetical protein
MAQYYKLNVTLDAEALESGVLSTQRLEVVVPTVGPQGPVGPQGEQGPPGEVSGSLAWDNVTDKPSTFPPSAHTHVAADITDFTEAVEAVSPPADWDTLANKPSSFTPSTHAASHHTGGVDALTAFSIGAESLFTSSSQTLSGSGVTLGAARAQIFTFNALSATTVTLPTTGNELGDRLILRGGSPVLADITISSTLITDVLRASNEQLSYIYSSTGSGARWVKNFVDVHTHPSTAITDFNAAAAAAAPVQSVNGSTGTVTVAVPSASTATPQALGTAAAGTSDDYSRGDHVHAAPALNDLSNVSAAAPSDNDVLVYDTATSTWVAEAAAASGIASDTTGITGASAISNIVAIQQADYDNIVSPDAATLFLITDP